MPDQVRLDRRHGQPLGWDADGELLDESRVGSRKESLINAADLIPVGQANLDLAVNAPRSNEGRIELLWMVGRGEQNPSLTGSNAIDCVQQATEGDLVGLILTGRTGDERAVDILDEHKRVDRYFGK